MKELVIFQGKNIRRVWHSEEWYYSVIDVVQALTNSLNPRNYWSMLKKRETEHEVELSTFCVQLKLLSAANRSLKKEAFKKSRIYS
mgnify:CR=1 FL=1